MSDRDAVRGHAVVVQPESGPSYWQPVPASGHADPALHPAVAGRKKGKAAPSPHQTTGRRKRWL